MKSGLRFFRRRGARKVNALPSSSLRRRGVYLLPSLFTTAALFSGYYAIVQAVNTKYEVAAISIILAMCFDAIDGRVARLTHTQSPFGAEYDSLADMVSFGVAPSLVMYEWALRALGKVGWMVAFIYCVAAALRLARFNISHEMSSKRYFTGLPSPAAAAVLACFLWLMTDHMWMNETVQWLSCALVLTAGLSMVSNVHFFSGKDFNLQRSVPWIIIFLAALLIVLIFANPPLVLFLLALGYLMSGYVLWLWHRRRT